MLLFFGFDIALGFRACTAILLEGFVLVCWLFWLAKLPALAARGRLAGAGLLCWYFIAVL